VTLLVGGLSVRILFSSMFYAEKAFQRPNSSLYEMTLSMGRLRHIFFTQTARMIPGLFGNCPACTPFQKKMLPKWLWIFADKYPLMFRAVVAQFLMDQGFDVPREEIPKIQEAMGFNEPTQIINPQGVLSASYDEALNTRQFKRQPDLISFFGRTRGGRW